MIDIKLSDEIYWWDKKYLARSLAFGLLATAFFWMLVERVKPAENFLFEHVPVVTGIYRCCSTGGRTSESTVGSTSISCSNFGYYGFLGSSNPACGFKDDLDGRTVSVLRVVTPSFGEGSLAVVEIAFDGKTYYKMSDERLRELWITSSQRRAFTLGFLFFVIFHGAQLIYFDQKSKKSQENKQ